MLRWLRAGPAAGLPRAPGPGVTRSIAALVIGGLLLRLGIAWITAGATSFDIESYRIAGRYIRSDPAHFYSIVNAFAVHGVRVFRWPYPPGYLPWLLALPRLTSTTGLDYVILLKVPSIVADGAIALIVQDFLGRRGYSGRARLAATALVAFGFPMIWTSALHAQIDSLAILPSVAAVWLWDDPSRPGRGWKAGLLIGIGAALKTVPLFVLLALLPTASGTRERLVVSAAAVVVPVVLLFPFLLTDPSGVLLLSSYHGVSGLGGISLLVQPSLASSWLNLGGPHGMSSLSIDVAHYGGIATGAIVLAVAVLLFYRRVPAEQGASLVWLAILALGTGFSFQYLCWGIPFFLMSGWLGAVLLLEVAYVLPLVLFEGWIRPAHRAVLYFCYVTLAWGALLAGFVWTSFAVLRGRAWGLKSNPNLATGPNA